MKCLFAVCLVVSLSGSALADEYSRDGQDERSAAEMDINQLKQQQYNQPMPDPYYNPLGTGLVNSNSTSTELGLQHHR